MGDARRRCLSTWTGMKTGDTVTYEIIQITTDGTGHVTTTDTAVVTPGNDICGFYPTTRYFKIDKATGQVSVRRKLSAEETDGRSLLGTGAGERLLTAGAVTTIVVRATDPSGEPNGRGEP